MVKERVKITQIAGATGLSVATVSRALNQDTAQLVKEVTKEKVYRAARRLNYVPNRMARSLRINKTNTFGYMMNFEADTITGYMHEILGGILDGLKGTNLDLKIISPGDHNSLSEIIRTHGLDGIILPHSYKYRFPDLDKESQQHKKELWPVVLLNDHHPRFCMNQIYSDNYQTTKCLAEYLIGKGCRHFYFIGSGAGSPAADERRRAFLETLAKHGIRFNEERDTANGYFHEKGGYDNTMALLAKRKDFRGAIFCINDAMALGAIRAIDEAGLKCPEDIAVVGFDGIAAGGFSNPPLTTIKFDLYGMGRMAIGTLRDILSGKQKRYLKRSIPFRLLERQSA